MNKKNMRFNSNKYQNITLFYNKKEDLLTTNNDKLKSFKSLDEYNRQNGKNQMPPKHGGLYQIKIRYKELTPSNNKFRNVIFMPVSSVSGFGPWHMMHHFFLYFNLITVNNLTDIDNIIFYLFTSKNDGKREKKIAQHLEPTYLKMFYEILKTNKSWETFKEEHSRLHNLFYQGQDITIDNFNVLSVESNNFDDKELLKVHMDRFKKTIHMNYNLKEEEENILVVRRKENRRFLNEKDMNNWLEEYCQTKNLKFKMIYLEDYTIREQLNFFFNAKTVIGVHGAGLTWCVFMKNNTNLIEIFPKGGGKEQYNDYLWFCNISNINYSRFEDNYTGDIKNFRKCDVKVTKEKLINEIDKFFSI